MSEISTYTDTLVGQVLPEAAHLYRIKLQKRKHPALSVGLGRYQGGRLLNKNETYEFVVFRSFWTCFEGFLVAYTCLFCTLVAYLPIHCLFWHLQGTFLPISPILAFFRIFCLFWHFQGTFFRECFSANEILSNNTM